MTSGSTSWLDDRAREPEDRDDADPEGDRRRKRRDRRILLWLVLVVVALVGGVYLAGHFLASERLPRGTTVAGVEVGGLTPRAAETELRRALAPDARRPIRVTVADREFEIDPERAGVEVDAGGSIAQVPVGQSWSPADIWESFVGGQAYDAQVVTIDGLLAERLDEIAAEVDVDPVEGAVRFRPGGAEATYPEAGEVLDTDAAVAAIADAYPTRDVVELPTEGVDPELSSRDVSRAMDDFANPAMAAPVRFTYGSDDVVLRPSQYARALSMTVEDGRLVPEVDRQALLASFGPAARGVAQAPRDATVEIRGGKPVVVPAQDGRQIDEDAVVEAFPEMLAASGDDRTRELPTTGAKAEVSTAEVRSWGIKERVSSFTTYYPHADYRNVNIGRAAALIDGTVLAPGETFSLNDTVGERTAENGFTEGFVISDGIFKSELGGGVSQVATTTYNAAYFAGLQDVEHKPHSFYIDRYPVGREATVVWPYVDLRFKNDTDHGVLIQTIHQPSSYGGTGSLTVRMWSTKTWDIESITGARYNYTSPATRRSSEPDCYPNTGYSGFTIDVTRVFREPGSSEVVKRETDTTVYTPSDTVICE